MAFISSMGSQPVGEVYLTPPDDAGVSWLMGQYYTGSQVKLLKFQKPVESPEDGSPIFRINTLEDDHVLLTEAVLTIMRYIKSAHSADLGISGLESHLSEKKAFIATRDELNTTDSPFMVTNVELLQKDRGWIGD